MSAAAVAVKLSEFKPAFIQRFIQDVTLTAFKTRLHGSKKLFRAGEGPEE
jgi:hypothetical protein